MPKDKPKSKKLTLGIDFGGSKILTGLITQDGNTKKYRKVETPDKKSKSSILNLTFNSLHELLEKEHLTMKDILGIGVAAPGLVDEKKGILLYAPNWNIRNFPLKTILKKKFPIPVKIANDINAAATGEVLFGHGIRERNFFWMTISTGIGGAIVINKKVISGDRGLAGEIGHTIVDESGPICSCGNNGCLESIASGPGILNMAKQRIKYSKKSCHLFSTKEIVRAANKGDSKAKDILDEAGKNISKAISYIVNIVDIEVIIIGGGVMQDNRFLIRVIEKYLKKYVYEYSHRKIKILTPKLGYNSSLIGAASLILADYLPES